MWEAGQLNVPPMFGGSCVPLKSRCLKVFLKLGSPNLESVPRTLAMITPSGFSDHLLAHILVGSLLQSCSHSLCLSHLAIR